MQPLSDSKGGLGQTAQTWRGAYRCAMNTAHPAALIPATTDAKEDAKLDAKTQSTTAASTHDAAAAFHLRFESLFKAGRGMVFPCDARGCVELDALSEPARRNYFYARAVVGREFATPAVVSG